MRRIPLSLTLAAALLLLPTLAQADDETQEAPQSATRELFLRGHSQLYRDGGLTVPGTELHLIPAGPSFGQLALDLAGKHTSSSLHWSWRRIKGDTDRGWRGLKWSGRAGKATNTAFANVAADSRAATRSAGSRLVHNSPEAGVTFAKQAWVSAGLLIYSGARVGESLRENGYDLAGGVDHRLGETAADLFHGALSGAREAAGLGVDLGDETLHYAWDTLRDYRYITRWLQKRTQGVRTHSHWQDFKDGVAKPWGLARDLNSWLWGQLRSVGSHYFSNIGHSLSQAGYEITVGVKETGTFAILKAAGWTLKAFTWDLFIAPAVGGGLALSGLAVNTLVLLPAMVLTYEGYETLKLATLVTVNTALFGVDLLLPVAKVALALPLGLGISLIAEGWALAELTLGPPLAATLWTVGKAGLVGITAVSAVLGYGTQYLLVPLASAITAVGGVVVGGLIVVGGVGSGVLTLVGGELWGLTLQLGGYVGAVVVALGSGLVTLAGNTLWLAADLVVAGVVPVSLQVGSLSVASYGTAAQLVGHGVLLVSDILYALLSTDLFR